MVLSEDEVRQIRERAERATPGPWKSDKHCVAFARQCTPSQSPEGNYAAPYGISIGGEFKPVAGYLPSDECDATADFIAAARTDVPMLCDTIAALRAERDALVAENARLRARLGRVRQLAQHGSDRVPRQHILALCDGEGEE